MTYRLIELHEIPNAFWAFGYPFAYRESVRAQVPGIWQEWVRNRSMTMFAFFDKGRMAAISSILFVSDEFVDQALRRPKPWTKSTLIEWHLEGRSPVLLPPDYRRANAEGGLNMFLPCDAFGDMSLGLDALTELDGYYGRTFAGVVGCRLKTKWWEGHGQMRWDLGSECGMLPWEEWDDPEGELEACPPEHRPYLGYFGLDTLTQKRGSYVASLFHFRLPQFGFTYEQQTMLARALDGETDTELADALCVSTSAIKKRWQSIYDRVDEIEPGLLPVGGTLQKDGAARGNERRRHLLRALRSRLEELGPEFALRIAG